MKFLKNWLFGPPSKTQYAKSFMSELRRAGRSDVPTYDDENFRLKFASGEELNLSNMYQEYCQVPRKDQSAHLRRIVQGIVASHDELPELFDEARGNLRPKIWLRSTMTNLELQCRLQGKDAFDSPNYPLGTHLVSAVVYDLPTTMRSLTSDDLEKWGVSYYEAMEAACDNLRESSIGFSRIGDNFYTPITGDNYDASRVLLTDKIQEWDVVGDHVAMIAQRDALYVTGTDDEISLKIMVELTESTMKDQPRPLSPFPLRLVDGEWEDWELPRDHPAYSQLEQLQTQFLGEIYADQKQLLDAIHEKENDGPFVATFSGIQHQETKLVSSYCVWSKDVDSLLPKTQLVMFASEAGVDASGEWDRVAAIVGELMELDEAYYPCRYRVTQYPSPDQLAAIGKMES